MRQVLLTSLLALGWASAACADDTAIRQAVSQLVPSAQISSIKPSAVKGFSEVQIAGQFVYVSNDGLHLFRGPLLDLKQQVDLTEQSRMALRKDLLSGIKPSQTIRYPGKSQDGHAAAHHITVFTDIDCGYCRKLHQQIAEINAAGVTVDYLFYPRGGLQSPSYDKAVSVWCASDPQQALTAAKAGQPVSSKMCANPIRDDFELALKMGVGEFGTPAVYADDGRQLGGYLSPPDLLKRLNEAPARKAAR